jgi:acyl-CoA reductase-like NAD-dependent aldehyde dehydrogenase
VTIKGAQTEVVRSPDRFFVGGEWVKPSTTDMIDVIQPATEELSFQVAEAKADDMDRAITAARLAFDEGPWPRMSHAQRAVYLRAIGDAIRRRSEDLGNVWTSEVGALQSIANVGSANVGSHRVGALYDYYATFADDYPFLERHRPTAGGNFGYLVREPVGVVGAIVPWNSPLLLMSMKVAPALIAGCTVIAKSSPEAPGEAYLLAEIAEEVGLPPGVFNCLTAHREVSELMVRDPRVDKIAFTGSTAAGRRIASICGDRIARYTLELGGKSAALVLDDYDVATAAKELARSTLLLSGQVCAALTRIVVSRERHDELVEALSESFSKVRIGDPYDSATQMGPLAMRRQRDRVEALIAKGVEQGAQLASGGNRPAGLDCGYYIEPTVFGHVDNNSTIAREEIFGPVLSVIAAKDEREAIDIANDSIYGLNASVFSNDEEHALSVARRLRSGTVGHNASRVDLGISFGGFKQSGVGREGGREGIVAYLETKTIILDAEPSSLQSVAE